MPENLYAAHLARFKQNEKPEAVLVVADNPELIKIVIAWTNLEVTLTDKFTKLAGTSDENGWSWLWENTKFSLTELKVNNPPASWGHHNY
jgi:hypothetical protein